MSKQDRDEMLSNYFGGKKKMDLKGISHNRINGKTHNANITLQKKSTVF